MELTKKQRDILNVTYNEALLTSRERSKELKEVEARSEEYEDELNEVGLLVGEAYANIQGMETIIEALGLKELITNYRWKY